MIEWSDEEKRKVAGLLEGTCLTIARACELAGVLEVEHPEDALLDVGLECCVDCGWWFESTFMDEDSVCEGCRA